MHNPNLVKTLAVTAAIGVASLAGAQTLIAQWSFNSGTVAAPDNTPAASKMLTVAFATQLGMTNSYTDSLGNTYSVASCDVLFTPPPTDPNPLSAGYTWRIRGNGGGGGNGWNLAAPQYTQGAEFDCSTVGYDNIGFSFDWYCTAQGIADLQLQYNLNVSNPNGWVNFSGKYNGNQPTVKGSNGLDTILVSNMPKDYNTAGTNVKTNYVDLSLIRGAANNPNFGIRLVSCYDPTAGTYLGASGGVYNNNSGNWRFDQINFISMNPTQSSGNAGKGPAGSAGHSGH